MRRFLSKKAEFSIMVAVLITLVVGISFLVIGYQMHQRSKDMGDEEKCRLSIFANAQIGKVKQKTAGFMDFPVAFECSRKSVKIAIEDVEKYDRIDDDLFKTVIAEEVKSCWAKVGSGKLDPFKASKNVNEHFCMVCSEFYLDADLKEQMARQDYEFKGFQYWIAGHKLPGIKTSLYEFITGTRPTAELLQSLKNSENDANSKFNFEEKYVVVWRVEKWEPGLWEEAAVVAGAAALGVLTMGVGNVVFGAAAGIGIIAVEDGAQISQQVLVIPEGRLSEQRKMTVADVIQEVTSRTPVSRAPVYDFCTRMIN